MFTQYRVFVGASGQKILAAPTAIDDQALSTAAHGVQGFEEKSFTQTYGLIDLLLVEGLERK